MELSCERGLLSKVAVFKLAAAGIWLVSIVVAESNSLLLVQMVLRHGARASFYPYPTDLTPPEAFPEGYGSITQVGKRQHYVLGNYLRSLYSGFLTFNPNEIFVNSSDSDRCIESALCNLASFYAPTSREWVVQKGFPWQPVVVHYTDGNYDKYLSVRIACPKLALESEKVFNSSDFLSEFDKHQDLFDALKVYGGINDTIDYHVVIDFQDIVLAEKTNGIVQPDWVEFYWDELTNLADLILFKLYDTIVQQRLAVGPLLQEIIENMDNKVAGIDDETKVQMYFTHDEKLGAFLRAFDLYENSPPFSACILIELHRIRRGPAVRLLYLNSTTPEHIHTIHPHLLKLKGCGEFCPLETFREIVQPIVPDDWDEECQTMD